MAARADLNVRRIIAYGLRNPFRFAFRPGTREIWVGDVGSDRDEEIDRIRNPTDATVENFGWPCYEGASRQPSWEIVEPRPLRVAVLRQRRRHAALLHLS